MRCFHNLFVECNNSISKIYLAIMPFSMHGFGNFAELAVESDADKISSRPLSLEHFSEVSFHVALNEQNLAHE